MRVIDAAAVEQATPFERLVPALRDWFARGCEVPTRQVLTLEQPDGAPAVTSLVMGAWAVGALLRASRSSTSRPATRPAACPACMPACCCTTPAPACRWR